MNCEAVVELSEYAFMKLVQVVIFKLQTDEISDLRTYLLVKFSHGRKFGELLQIFIVSKWFVPFSTYHLDCQIIDNILTKSINDQVLSLTFKDIEYEVGPLVLLLEISLESSLALCTVNRQLLSQLLELVLQLRIRTDPPKQSHQLFWALLSIQQANNLLSILYHNSIANNMLPFQARGFLLSRTIHNLSSKLDSKFAPWITFAEIVWHLNIKFN